MDEMIRNEVPVECTYVEIIRGEDFSEEFVNSSHFGKKMKKHNIPSSREFRIYKYKNPRTLRQLLIMKCDHDGCTQFFRKWHNFYNHLRFHTKERPFRCPFFAQCGQSFSQRSNLNKHLKVHQEDQACEELADAQ